MNPKYTLRYVGIALMLLVSFLIQGTWALAGTTGAISGNVVDEKGAGVANATVTVSAASGTSSTATDATGHFVFLSLGPDTYTVSTQKSGFTPTAQAGVTVNADQTRTLAIRVQRENLREIGRVTSRSSSDLVKPGTTSDVYSVNAATAEKVAAIGGGTNLNNAYSALASQPGVTLGYGGIGWGQTVFIHGASYSQVGFEFDGIPVNRAFDNYNANTLTNLGQQELQVVTGGAPSSSSSETVGGFINQVIRNGTYPGFGNLEVGLGSPTYYHQLKGEVGGATPNRLFSYYVGMLGYDQDQRYGDQFNGGSGLPGTIPFFATNTINTANQPGAFPFCNSDGSDPRAGLGPPIDPTNPTGPTQLDQGCVGGPFPYNYGAGTGILQDREAIANFHIGIPHKHDQGKDDIQLLYNGSYLRSFGLTSVNDAGGPGFFVNQLAPPGGRLPFWADGVQYPSGVSFGQVATSTLAPIPYYFPSSPTNRCANVRTSTGTGVAIPGACPTGTRSFLSLNQRDATENDAQIFKVQYQKNIGSNAYARVYGYSFYSDWLQNGPVFGATSAYAVVAPYSRDYELITHTRGGEFQFADQINPKNLLTATANYTTAGVSRFNNGEFANAVGSNCPPASSFDPVAGTGACPGAARRGPFTNGTGTTNLVDASGNCYSIFTGAQAPCFSSSTTGNFGDPTRSRYCADPGVDPVTGKPNRPCNPAGNPAGTQFMVTYTGPTGTLNKVKPKFSSYALTDQFRPNDRLLINAGVRFEQFAYDLVNSNTPDYNFWFKAAQNSYCYDPANGNQPVVGATRAFTTPPLFVGLNCPNSPISGQPTLHPNGQNGALLYSNSSPANITKRQFEPRLSATYTFNPDSVLRFSIGKYANPANTATYQYLNASAKTAATFDFQNFFGLGFTTPVHNVEPATSTNADLSYEHRVKGTDITFKLSPYYRYVKNQTQDFFIGPGFVSAIPTGNETAYGVEFQINKGDPSRNGLSGQLSYTYNKAYMKFFNLSNGVNPVDPINGAIDAYNALTASGNRFGVKGAPCYDGSGNGTPAAPGACSVVNGQVVLNGPASTGTIINPYYTDPTQPIIDRNASYKLYQSFPNPLSAPGFADTNMSILWPQVLAGFVSYKHNRLSITPNFQMIQGFSGGSNGGGQYGSPLSVVGLDPRACTSNQGQAGVTTTNPGFCNYITAGNSPNNLGVLNVPDPITGRFDSVGEFQNPWLLNINAQIRYDISQKVTANLVLANIFNRCFGGDKKPWTSASAPGQVVCGYNTNNAFVGTRPGAGFFNGASPNDPVNGPLFSQLVKQPYQPLSSFLPFNAYLSFSFKI